MKSKILKTIVAIVIGEIALVLLTTLAQEVLFDGISYTQSSQKDLILGGIATFLAAVLAGWVAALIGGKNNWWPHLFISVIITIEMTYLISKGLTKDPIWFDVLAGLSLIFGVWLGFAIQQRKP